MVKIFSRVAVAGAAVAMVFAGTASQASAAEAGVLTTDITISNSHGKMIFHDDGDMFEVCDTNADGYGMEGMLIGAVGQTLLDVTDGGDAGCDKGGYNVGNCLDTCDVQMRLYWNGGGSPTLSRWFNE